MDEIYKSIIEALIFSSDEPLPASEIINAITDIDGDDIKISKNDIDKAVDNLNKLYERKKLSFRIVSIANGYSFATQSEYAKYVGFLSTEKSKRRLSPAALETISIIAYKQPITKPEIEAIRGVNSDFVINTLLERKIIDIKGRADTVGRPLLYVTNDEFLKYFGLNKISDLPKPREIDEIMKDEDFIEQKRKIMMNEVEEMLEETTTEKSNDET
ncbi:MAG: SMC-Scp complex subunit ScpB [Ignavibacteriales bacterium]|nr:SMC-Scp complex subunit ScpB [Ignavibacteriales bacterium]